ncbi:acyl-CoA N-acyltransferase [Rhodocollybia butyracea]|uniref:Acyl-CoA N-acyltransferase n=1 Tax=Rhodocollybia butyracea TaxID=206335 RepID=A0A9P5PU08_9AGAR|nr:acyl-CoA N-acyltransferase [Rhodocollybia butyracea]
MDVKQNPVLPQNTIIIRPFCPADTPQVRDVYFTGLVTGADSAGHIALVRAFLHWTPMYLAYLLSITGGVALFLPQQHIRLFGLALVLLSCSFMLFEYYRIRTTFLGYYQDGLLHDMADISQYYGLNQEKDGPIRSFWVAEIPSEQGYKIVGCVALDCPPKSDGPMTGELRRLFVLPAYRKRGIGTKLIRALICYAKQRGVPTLKLETTNYQSVAREMYTRLGWRHNSTRDSDFEAGGLRMNFIEYQMQL